MSMPNFIFSYNNKIPSFKFKFNNCQHKSFNHSDPERMGETSLYEKGYEITLSSGYLTLKFCERLLDEITKHDILEEFRRPFDKDREEFRDFYKEIEEPMDLETLRNRLMCGNIATVAEFKRNLDLIWSNFQKYSANRPNLKHLCEKADMAQRTIEYNWKICLKPNSNNIIEKLRKIKEYLTAAEKSFAKTLDIPDRIKIPPVPEVDSSYHSKKHGVQQKEDIVPSLNMRREMATKISTLEPDSDAWNLIRSFLMGKKELMESTLESREFNLNMLDDNNLIELNKILNSR